MMGLDSWPSPIELAFDSSWGAFVALSVAIAVSPLSAENKIIRFYSETWHLPCFKLLKMFTIALARAWLMSST